MVEIRRAVGQSDLHCHRCDYYEFKRRKGGRWAYCAQKEKHFPDGLDIRTYRCAGLTIRGNHYGTDG